MQDLPRLGIVEVVPLLRLPRRQCLEGRPCKVGLERQGLVRGDQAVASEQGHEPRQAGSGQRIRERLQGTKP